MKKVFLVFILCLTFMTSVGVAWEAPSFYYEDVVVVEVLLSPGPMEEGMAKVNAFVDAGYEIIDVQSEREYLGSRIYVIYTLALPTR